MDSTGGPLTTPPDVLRLAASGPLPEGLVMVTTGEVRTTAVPQADDVFFYHLAAQIRALDTFTTRLAKVAPAATLNVYDLDLDRLETYRVERGAVDGGIAVGFALSLAAFLISSLSQSRERRADNGALAVLGMRPRELRTVQRIQLLVPLLIALPAATAIGVLGGNSLMRASGRNTGWYFGGLSEAAGLTALALALAWVAGSAATGGRLRPADLRRD